ncbi:MAG: hypothetical protein M3153_05445 [Chloroflexota bacterium]|nr:hypothetical protein [Chloroflexota bacterium]
MIGPRGIIGRMPDLGRRLIIGLGVIAVGIMAVGYAYIFGGIAKPVSGARAVLDLPPSGTASAALLDDGRPVFVVNDPEAGMWVLDAQRPQPPGTVGEVVAWCPQTRLFVNLEEGTTYASDGRLLGGPADQGLVAFATRASPDEPGRIIVETDTEVRGRSAAGVEPATGCANGMVVHEPHGDETFDPSVAADQEPPGWIWLEGTVRVVDDAVRLCDGRGRTCEGFAPTVGIDPASLDDDAAGVGGRFIGRVRDGAIEGLMLVPDTLEAS